MSVRCLFNCCGGGGGIGGRSPPTGGGKAAARNRERSDPFGGGGIPPPCLHPRLKGLCLAEGCGGAEISFRHLKGSHMPTKKKRIEYCLVRFNKMQFEQISAVAEAHGVKMAALLRDAYFRKRMKKPPVPLHLAKKVELMMEHVHTILNGASALIDSGFREGFHPEMEKARALAREIIQMIGGEHGNGLDQAGKARPKSGEVCSSY